MHKKTKNRAVGKKETIISKAALSTNPATIDEEIKTMYTLQLDYRFLPAQKTLLNISPNMNYWSIFQWHRDSGLKDKQQSF